MGKKTDVRDSTNASDVNNTHNLYSPEISKDPGLFSADSRSKEISVIMTPSKGKMKDLSPRLHELRRIKHSQMPNSFRQGTGRNNGLQIGEITTPSQAVSQWTWGGNHIQTPTMIDKVSQK